MKALSGDRMDELLRALAHPDRRKFIEICRERAYSAGELAQQSELALASVSEHLKVLRKTGLLEMQAVGRFRVFRANQPLLGQILLAVALLVDG